MKINTFTSKVRYVQGGVSQGSSLGPLIFNIYLNDIISVNPKANFIVYTNGTSIYFIGNHIHHLIEQCKNKMKNVEE